MKKKPRKRKSCYSFEHPQSWSHNKIWHWKYWVDKWSMVLLALWQAAAQASTWFNSPAVWFSKKAAFFRLLTVSPGVKWHGTASPRIHFNSHLRSGSSLIPGGDVDLQQEQQPIQYASFAHWDRCKSIYWYQMRTRHWSKAHCSAEKVRRECRYSHLNRACLNR